MSPTPLALAQHLGDLHPYEQALVALIAFGPFVVLVFVVWVVRRRDLERGEARGAGDLEHRES